MATALRHQQGKTLLMFMAASGCPRAVKAVISLGANVNMRDCEGWTALMAACQGSEQISAGIQRGNEGDMERCEVIAPLSCFVLMVVAWLNDSSSMLTSR